MSIDPGFQNRKLQRQIHAICEGLSEVTKNVLVELEKGARLATQGTTQTEIDMSRAAMTKAIELLELASVEVSDVLSLLDKVDKISEIEIRSMQERDGD